MGYSDKIPHYYKDDGTPRLKIHMNDLFQMFSGTSTGGIIAISLAVNKKDN